MKTKKRGKTKVQPLRNIKDIKNLMDYFRDRKEYDNLYFKQSMVTTVWKPQKDILVLWGKKQRSILMMYQIISMT